MVVAALPISALTINHMPTARSIEKDQSVIKATVHTLLVYVVFLAIPLSQKLFCPFPVPLVLKKDYLHYPYLFLRFLHKQSRCRPTHHLPPATNQSIQKNPPPLTTFICLPSFPQRGGAGNISSPHTKPTNPAGHPGDTDVVPETAIKGPPGTGAGYENFHVGRGGEGNVHREGQGGGLKGKAEGLKEKILHPHGNGKE